MDRHIRYQELDAARITGTIEALSSRIGNQFPESGLFGVSQKLLEIGRRAAEQADWISKPIITLRVIIGSLILVILAALIATIYAVSAPTDDVTLIDFVQTLEAGINDVVLIGLAIFFLATSERRLKRHRALQAIHELRAIAHIIDMHQLTKDPNRLHWDSESSENALSPKQLTHYLDYCSELLSLVGKVSVLYVQKFDDPVALTAVNEVESLTTGLSRKIWQKLMIIHGTNANEPRA